MYAVFDELKDSLRILYTPSVPKYLTPLIFLNMFDRSSY